MHCDKHCQFDTTVDSSITELDDRGIPVRFPERARIFSLLCSVQTGSGASSASFVPQALLEGKATRAREADHSPLSRAEVKNARDISPLSHPYSRRNA
jgi:hypothetical protein